MLGKTGARASSFWEIEATEISNEAQTRQRPMETIMGEWGKQDGGNDMKEYNWWVGKAVTSQCHLVEAPLSGCVTASLRCVLSVWSGL